MCVMLNACVTVESTIIEESCIIIIIMLFILASYNVYTLVFVEMVAESFNFLLLTSYESCDQNVLQVPCAAF